jgi:hypothetical protein
LNIRASTKAIINCVHAAFTVDNIHLRMPL